MKKELKQKIKQDEFVSTVTRVTDWVALHREEVKLTSAVVVLLAVAAGALHYFEQRRAQQAEQAMAAALELYHAPVASELPEGSEPPAGRVFATSGEKYRQAAAVFDGLERRFPSAAEALEARYYGALCRIRLGEASDAEKALAEVAAAKDRPLVSALARLALAEAQRRAGQVDKAVQSYQQLVDDAGSPLPRDYALLSLAGTLEEAHRAAEARAAYRRLVEEFPDSVYAPEARQRAEYLEGVGQG